MLNHYFLSWHCCLILFPFYISPEELKQLLRCQPPCPDLCCHLVTLYPPHALIFAKQLKKHSTILPTQAPLLSLLLSQKENVSAAESALTKISGKLSSWVLNFDEEDNETRLLIPHALQRNILGKLVSILVTIF